MIRGELAHFKSCFLEQSKEDNFSLIDEFRKQTFEWNSAEETAKIFYDDRHLNLIKILLHSVTGLSTFYVFICDNAELSVRRQSEFFMKSSGGIQFCIFMKRFP